MNNLRPNTFDEIVGQSNAIAQLKISVGSAKARADCLGHTLFTGPAGLGKTTMATTLATELDAKIALSNGASISSIKNLMPYVMKLEKGDILFVDEIHGLPAKVQEFLFPVMEDFRVDLSNGKATQSIDLPKFTIIGATTEGGSLLKPLRDRFVSKIELSLYSDDELFEIMQKSKSKLDLNIEDGAVLNLAKRARGTPRIANNHLLWMRDYALANSIGTVQVGDVQEAMKIVGVDEKGRTPQDRRYLHTLASMVASTGGPVGLATLVSSSNIDRDTIVNVVEPFLLRNKIIAKTPKGRIVL